MNSLKKQIVHTVHISASLLEHIAAEDGRRPWHHMETAAAARHTERQAVEGPGTSPLSDSYSYLPWPAICCDVLMPPTCISLFSVYIVLKLRTLTRTKRINSNVVLNPSEGKQSLIK